MEAGVNGLDLSSLDEQFGLHEAASAKGMIFVPGVGATPGVTNMMVAKAAEQLDRLDTVEVAFAAFRSLAPAPGLLTTTLWEFDPEEEARQQVVFEDGAWTYSPPLSGGKRFRFHDLIGEQAACYVPHDEAYTLPRSRLPASGRAGGCSIAIATNIRRRRNGGANRPTTRMWDCRSRSARR